jgi:hypothetical protein
MTLTGPLLRLLQTLLAGAVGRSHCTSSELALEASKSEKAKKLEIQRNLFHSSIALSQNDTQPSPAHVRPRAGGRLWRRLILSKTSTSFPTPMKKSQSARTQEI